jgi:uncharacterized OsmC-like protein
MSALDIRLLGAGDTAITHLESGTTIRSSKSPAYGGSGASFSSTDLLAAGLGSCIATNVEPVAERHGVSLDRIRVTVTKRLLKEPKRLDALDVRVSVEGDTAGDILLRFERAAQHCLVHQSLAPHVAVGITVEAAATEGAR